MEDIKPHSHTHTPDALEENWLFILQKNLCHCLNRKYRYMKEKGRKNERKNHIYLWYEPYHTKRWRWKTSETKRWINLKPLFCLIVVGIMPRK